MLELELPFNEVFHFEVVQLEIAKLRSMNAATDVVGVNGVQLTESTIRNDKLLSQACLLDMVEWA